MLRQTSLISAAVLVVLCSTCVCQAQPGPPADGAIALWEFDEGAGTTATDSSTAGGDHPGLLTGDVTWVTDAERGTVLAFDSFDGFVDIPSFNLTTNTVTFTAWINGHKNANWTGLVMSRGTDHVGVGISPDDRLCYVWGDDPNTYGWLGGPVIPADQWTFVAMTIDPAKAQAYVGFNGELLSGENVYPHVSQTIDALEIGRDSCCGDSRYFVGMMDQVAIYDRVLTVEELSAMAIPEPSTLAMLLATGLLGLLAALRRRNA